MTEDDVVVFVYGTLRPGQPNYCLAAPGVAAFVGAHGHGLRLYAASHRGFPYAAAGHRKDVIVGALLTLRRDRHLTTLQRLDHLEGFDPDHPDRGHYQRRRRTFVTDQASWAGPAGTATDAWIYLAGPQTPLRSLHTIPSGDWVHQTPQEERADLCVTCSV